MAELAGAQFWLVGGVAGCLADGRMIVDTHVHLYPLAVNDAPEDWARTRREGHWATLCTRRRKNGRPVQGFPSVDALLQAMDEAEVTKSVLQGWYWQNGDSCTEQNRFYAECVRAHPDRFAALATIQPLAGVEAVRAELHRAEEAGFCGLGELSPDSQGYTADDPAWRLAMEFAEARGWIVSLHVTDPDAAPYPGKIETPLGQFVELAQTYPRSVFWLAHWGGRLPLRSEWAMATRELVNVYYDTAAAPLIYRTAPVLAEMVSAVGAQRVLFGTDYPLVLYPALEDNPSIRSYVDEIRRAQVDPADVRAILGENAWRLLSRRP